MMPLEQIAQAEALPARLVPAALLLLHARRARVDGRGDRRNAGRVHLRADHRGRPHGGARRRRRVLPPHERERGRSARRRSGWPPPQSARSPGQRAARARAPPAAWAPRNTTRRRCPSRRKRRCSTPPTTPQAATRAAAGPRSRTRWAATTSRRGSCSSTSTRSPRNRAEFDALSMLFTVKFEQSPPAWIERGDDARTTRAARRAASARTSSRSSPAPTASSPREIDKFVAFAEAQGTVRLDVAKVDRHQRRRRRRCSPPRSRKLRKSASCRCGSTTSRRFEKVLRAAFNEKRRRGPAALLAAALRALHPAGQAPRNSRSSALEYAVAFEMSPPNWEVYVNTVAAARPRPPPPRARAARRARARGGLRAEGRALGGERQPDRRAERLRRLAHRGGGGHGQGAAHRVRLHLGASSTWSRRSSSPASA